MNFESIRSNILSEWTPLLHHAFHLHRALPDAWRLHVERRHRRQTTNAELVGLVAVSPVLFLLGDGIFSRSERKPIDMRDLVLRWKIDHTLPRSDEVVRRLAHGAEPQHATPS